MTRLRLLLFISLSFTVIRASAQDTIPPTVICQDITLYIDSFGSIISITPADVDNGSFDNVGIDTMYLSQYDFDCGDVSPWYYSDTTTVTLYIQDNAGNIDSCNAIVWVLDTIAPVINCRDTTIYLDQYGGFWQYLYELLPSMPLDNCDPSVGAYNLGWEYRIPPPPPPEIYFFCENVGQNEINLLVNDRYGNVGSCPLTVTVLDTTPPIASCAPPITRYLSSYGYVSVYEYYFYNSWGCAVDTIEVSQTLFTCEDIGVNDVIVTVTDTFGNVTTCTTEVTIINNYPLATGCRDSILTYLGFSGSTSLGATSLLNGSPCAYSFVEIDQEEFTCANVGNNTVTLTYTDTMGNTGTCSTIVSIVDLTKPSIQCRDTTIYINEFSVGIDPGALLTNASDSCGLQSITENGQDIFGGSPNPPSPTYFNCSNLGEFEFEYEAIDVNGNSRTCISTVTILDTTPPEIVCHDTTLYLYGNNTSYAEALIWNGYTLIDYNDNCSLTGLDMLGGWGGRSSVPPPPPPDILMWCSDVGELNEILYTANDASGNSSSCISVVTVIDTLRPVFTSVPTDVTVCSGIANGANVYFATPTAVDVCGLDSIWLSGGLPSGSWFPLGVTTNTFTALDVNGNTRSASFTVTVLSEAAPIADFSYTGNFCADSEFEFTGNTADTNLTYSWNFGDGSHASGMDTAHTYTSSGSFDVTLNVTNSFGCVDTSSQTLTLLPQPGLSVTAADVSCHSGMDGSISATATGSPLFYYSIDGSPQTVNNTFMLLQAGTHTITVMDASGCTNDTTVVINEPEPVELSLITLLPTNCPDDPIGLIEYTASGGTPPYLYSIGGGTTNTTGSFNYLTAGEYIIYVADANACFAHDTIEIIANLAVPAADFSFTQIGPSLSFTNTTIGSTSSDTYVWSFGDGNTSSLSNPSHTYADNGAYYVSLIVNSACGSDTVGYWVQVTGVGINDIDDRTLIDISPNPNDGSFTLQLESAMAFNKLSIRIWSVDGKLIASEEINASGKTYKGNLNYTLASGVYTLELVVGENSYHKRLVVK